MLITYDDERMLELWRQGASLEPALAEASIERFDSLDITRRLRTAMRAWYIDYLTTAPVDKVPVTDLTEYVRTAPGPGERQITVQTVCETARITSIVLNGFGLVPLLDIDDVQQMSGMGNRFIRHGDTPKAFYRAGSDTAVINYPGDDEPEVAAVHGVLIPEDDVYIVDERVLADIPALAQASIADL